MPRILMTCSTTQLPVSTGFRAPMLDLATVMEELAFRCGCGLVHRWRGDSAWVEAPRSLDLEVAAAMRSFDPFNSGMPE
jgi:hypothetical protein